MNATFNTKSNYKNCNGVSLEIVEISGVRVTAIIPLYGFDEFKQPNGCIETKADFTLEEVVCFSLNAFKKS